MTNPVEHPASEAERLWIVTYNGHNLHLTGEEYLTLKRATYDDPLRAEALALEHLRAQLRG